MITTPAILPVEEQWDYLQKQIAAERERLIDWKDVLMISITMNTALYEACRTNGWTIRGVRLAHDEWLLPGRNLIQIEVPTDAEPNPKNGVDRR